MADSDVGVDEDVKFPPNHTKTLEALNTIQDY